MKQQRAQHLRDLWRASTAIALVMGVAASCGSGRAAKADSTAALAACQSSGKKAAGTGATLRVAYAVAGPVLAKWEDAELSRAEARARAEGAPPLPIPLPRTQSFAQTHAADRTVYICYFDGSFPHSNSVSPGHTEPPTPNRARVLVATDGTTAVDATGFHNTAGQPEMALSRPN